jgi:beta-N-acetylhexosaminidase
MRYNALLGGGIVENRYQVLMIGLRGYELTPEEEQYLNNYSPGGVIFFGRNIRDVNQIAELSASIYELCDVPPLIGIDQEGGLVDRLRPLLTSTLSAEELAGNASLEQIERYGEITGHMLTTLGMNMNFAPVVDIRFSNADNALPRRYWGATPEQVVANASAILDGQDRTGVISCLKHFPGLGRTTEDSHFTLPRNDAGLEELRTVDIEPYVHLAGRVPFVMIAHCHFTAFDPDVVRPSSISPPVYDYLRNELGYTNAVVTDDLSMAGIDDGKTCDYLVSGPLGAGADLLPFCNNFDCIDRCFDLLDQAIKEKHVSEDRVEEAAGRILAVKSRIMQTYFPDQRIHERFTELRNRMKQLRLEVMTYDHP